MEAAILYLSGQALGTVSIVTKTCGVLIRAGVVPVPQIHVTEAYRGRGSKAHLRIEQSVSQVLAIGTLILRTTVSVWTNFLKLFFGLLVTLVNNAE